MLFAAATAPAARVHSLMNCMWIARFARVERCCAHMLIICKHVFNVCTLVVLVIFVRHICLLYSFVSSVFSLASCALFLLLLLYFLSLSRIGWNIRTLSCHFRRRVQFPQVSSVGNAFNIYTVYFSILFLPSFIHSLNNSNSSSSSSRTRTNRQIS